MKIAFSTQLLLGLWAEPAEAQDPAAPTIILPEVPAVELAHDDPSLELADIDRRSQSATGLYITSGVLLGLGILGGGGGALLSLVAGLSGPGFVIFAATAGVVGGLSFLGHIVTLVIAICLDVGSGARRTNFRARHPELAMRITGGAGDAGLGLALDF